MAVDRKLVWRDETSFEGWTCSGCGWEYQNPSREDPSREHPKLVKDAFDNHKCEEFPRLQKKHKAASS